MKATIDRFEGDKAVLVLEDGHQLLVNNAELLPDSKESDVLTLSFAAEAQAKAVLNEILKTKED